MMVMVLIELISLEVWLEVAGTGRTLLCLAFFDYRFLV